MKLKQIFRWVLALVFCASGMLHFVVPEFYLDIMPDYLPAPRFLVGITGLLEVIGGTCLLIYDLRKYGSWILILLLLAFFPIHIQHVMDHGYISDDISLPPILVWGRLGFQCVLLVWASWVGKVSKIRQKKLK